MVKRRDFVFWVLTLKKRFKKGFSFILNILNILNILAFKYTFIINKLQRH